MTQQSTGPSAAAGNRLDWRPQGLARGDFRAIEDPLVEPLWDGIRVLVHIADGRVTAILDQRGTDRAATYPGVGRAIEAALAEAPVPTGDAVIDGYITADPDAEPAAPASAPLPSAKGVVTQMMIGSVRVGRNEPRAAAAPDPEADPGFVAIDLLVVDDTLLLDVPLLERKRLLESVLGRTSLVRCTPYARPPVDSHLPAWRALGHRGLTYKAANGRYRPGAVAADWAVASMPQS